MKGRPGSIGLRTAGAALALALAGLPAGPAWALYIQNLTIAKNAGNTPDAFQSTLADSYQIASSTEVVSATSTFFRTRYASIVAADSGVGVDSTRSLVSDYTISFEVVAAGTYQLDITTELLGAMTMVDDGFQASTDVSTVLSTASPAVSSGTLDLADVNPAASPATLDIGFSRNSLATISGTSNGVPVPHTLTFQWVSTCTSDGNVSNGGDECAVRTGLPAVFANQTAGVYPGLGSRSQSVDGHFVSINLVSTSPCGNGVLDAGEDCDLAGGNGFPGSCCAVGCTFLPAGTTCRAGSDLCDPSEQCSGSSSACPADVVASAGTVCRGAAGVCDIAEVCDGTGTACPADGLVPGGTICRASTGACDVDDVCTGASVDCPPDAKSSGVCRASAGGCDPAEICDGVSDTCPGDVISTAGTVCRASAGSCDIVESCDGISTACPTDVVVSAGTACRGFAGPCDVPESCNGVSGACPADTFVSAGTVCRAAAGVCDLAETCTGAAAACPSDAKSTGVCRPAVDVCDESESCNGSSDACPADAISPNGKSCRASTGLCDLAETCNGVSTACPADGFAASGVVCRAVAGACDLAETCTGSSAACPADGFQSSALVCRPSAGVCDVEETCSGSSATCPANAFQPSSVECRASAAVCDAAEFCSGASPTCPADALAPPTTICRSAAGACDVGEHCTGASSACPADGIAALGTVCRPVANVCDQAEACDGFSIACPADTGFPDSDGDTACDTQDNCPAVANPSQSDGDGDSLGDACDECTRPAGESIVKPALQLKNLSTPPGDDLMVFRGTTVVPNTPAIDPYAHGFRLVLRRANGTLLVDATIPGGAYDGLTKIGWRKNGSGTSFRYKNYSGAAIAGIKQLVVRNKAGKVFFVVKAQNGAFPVTSESEVPLHATVVLSPPVAANGQCGTTSFLTQGCDFASNGVAVVCK